MRYCFVIINSLEIQQNQIKKKLTIIFFIDFNNGC